MQASVLRVVIGIGAFIAAAVTIGTFAATSVLAHPSIDIAVSNWKFVPAKITIPAGEPTVLRLTSTEGVHGIQSDELGIRSTVIANGKIVVLSFTPKKIGTYVVHCAVFCGAGHSTMGLTVNVADPSTKGMSYAAVPTTEVAVGNWKFSPAKITVPIGVSTMLRLTGTSGVHGIESKDLGVPLTTIADGKVVEVSFTPKKAGTYIMHCMVVCGPGHADMALTVVVADATASKKP